MVVTLLVTTSPTPEAALTNLVYFNPADVTALEAERTKALDGAPLREDLPAKNYVFIRNFIFSYE